MRRSFSFIILLALVLVACGGEPSVTPTAVPVQPGPVRPSAIPPGRCGDGRCDGPENATNCPQDCASPIGTPIGAPPGSPTPMPIATPTAVAGVGSKPAPYEPGPEPNTYWVTNPTSGVPLWVEVMRPSDWDGEALPALVLIPGGTDDSGAFTDERETGQLMADEGYTVVVFDADGRGRSKGEEDQCGYIHQDGLAAVIRFAAGLPEVDPERIGLVSYSYGVTMATGALARYQDLPILFYVDWEGPANRNDTGGCDEDRVGHLKGRPCDDEEFWREREASTFALKMRVPYQRLQSAKDHAQPDVNHALLMIANATSSEHGGHGVSPWTRLNDLVPNTVYAEADPPRLPPKNLELKKLTLGYIAELFDRFSPGGSVPVTELLPSPPGVPGEAPMLFASMTHMEGGHKDDENQNLFLLHLEQLRYGMDLAEEYGAKLTIESEKPFALACQKWGFNVLQEVLDRGHGVGTHGDVGYGGPTLNPRQLVRAFEERKALVDALVGAEHNRGISGGGGVTDWVLAAHEAGFKYVDGIVGMHYLSMPLENRPDASWTDEYIRAESFHDCAPVEFAQRIYPVMLADATDFEPDEDGVVLCSTGGIGCLDGMVEAMTTGCQGGKCPFTKEDVDLVVEKILEADRIRDPSRVAKVQVYMMAPLFVPQNEEVLRYFFGELQALQDQGIIAWATQGEVYDTYVAWNR